MSIVDKLDKEIYELLEKTKKKDNKKNILVMSGGGIKGIGHIGALKALQDLNYLSNINIIAGTSIGALLGFMLVIGYKPDELFNFIMIFDIQKIFSIVPANIFKYYGLDNGDNIMLVISKLIIAKKLDPEITFIELYKKTLIKLIITSSCINDKKIYYFSHETYPNMQVLKAIRMSISIPIYFAPVTYENQIYIDGGCIDNYPIQLFNNDLDNVIGLYVSANYSYTQNINNIEDFLTNMIQCLFEGVVCNSLKGFEKQSIKININNSKIGEFNSEFTNEDKKTMYDIGYKCVMSYFDK